MSTYFSLRELRIPWENGLGKGCFSVRFCFGGGPQVSGGEHSYEENSRAREREKQDGNR